MREVRKPGGNSKVASVTFVFQLETRTVSHQCFTDFPLLPQATWKFVWAYPNPSGSLQKWSLVGGER